MLPGAVHLHAVNPWCGERLLIRNNQPQGRGASGAEQRLMEGAGKSQSTAVMFYRSRERRMIRPVWGSTSTQITRPFWMNFMR